MVAKQVHANRGRSTVNNETASIDGTGGYVKNNFVVDAYDWVVPQTPEVSRKFIRPGSLRGESGDAYQVRPRHRRIVRCAQVFVNDGDFPFRRCEGCNNHQAERLPYAVAVPAIFLDVDNTDERVAWIDQI